MPPAYRVDDQPEPGSQKQAGRRLTGLDFGPAEGFAQFGFHSQSST